MAGGLFDPEGGGDPTLTGVESRTLRALLQLERRHIAILAEAAGELDTTTDRVVQWERSEGRGYPVSLVVLLRDIEDATAYLGRELAHGAVRDGTGRVTIMRPKSADEIAAALALPTAGVRFSDAQLKALRDGGGDFWQRLGDAAVIAATSRIDLAATPEVHIAYSPPSQN